MKINVINIGCFKNLVDCEKLMKQLLMAGHDVVFGESNSLFDIAIINTCGFIGSADSDSLQLLKLYAKRKSEYKIKELWVMGCYSQKRGEKLRIDIPEVDRIYGNFDWVNILVELGSKSLITHERTLTTPSHYAYLKISEGCNQPCTYCIKPIINGPLTSKPMEKILDEVRWLIENGVKELQVVAQNLTSYGMDLYGEKRIAELVERIADVPGVEWIRLHYGYPAGFPRDLFRVIRERDNVCNYLDMALQHCNTTILKRMRRGMSKELISDLLAEIREEVPGIAIRTTMMVGFPGETKDMFDELCQFVQEEKFERMGVFRYSPQQGSYSCNHYYDDVPDEEKTRRALALMDIQNQHYIQLNDSLHGTRQKVIVDEYADGMYHCRTEHSTPMADPMIFVDSKAPLQIGSFQDIIVTETLGKNMKGRTI